MSVTQMLLSGQLTQTELPEEDRAAATFFLTLTRVGLSLLLVSLCGAALLNAQGTVTVVAGLAFMAAFTGAGVWTARRFLPAARIRALVTAASRRARSYNGRLVVLSVLASVAAVVTRDAGILIGMAGAVTAAGAGYLALALMAGGDRR